MIKTLSLTLALFLYSSFNPQMVAAIQGVDVSSYVSDWSCLRNAGYDFAIPRAWKSYGAFDSNAVANI